MPNFLRNFIFQRMRQKAGDIAAPTINRSIGQLHPTLDAVRKFTTTADKPLRSFPSRNAVLQAPGLPKPPAGVARGGGLSPAAAGGITVGGLSAGAVLAGASNLLGDPFGITQALAGTAGKPNQSRMSLLGGVNSDPFIPATTPMQRAKVGQPMVLGGRLGYKAADGSWQPRGDMESENIPQYLPDSPKADKRGYVWDAPRTQEPGSQPPTTTPPAVVPRLSPEERAYNAERSRIAQLTEQNPEFQNISQLRNNLRDQGMAIWAAKYGGQGGLAERVKPGQVGYDAIQGALAAPTLEQMPEGIPTQGPTPNIPQIDPTLNPASPNYLGGEGPPLMNFADPRFENMSPEEFQKLLNQVGKK